MLKLGTYGLPLRFGVFLFPEAATWAKPLFPTLAAIGITYGAIVATMQKDLKRLVAYSSIAHLGFIVLGVFAITRQSITGGVLQMINHGSDRRCSSSSAGSTNAATPVRSPSCAACRWWRRCSPPASWS